MNERAAQIVSMRTEGKALQEIADHFGISRSRARQIYLKAKAQEQQIEVPGYVADNEPLLKLGLNPRSCNALNRVGVSTVGQLLTLLKENPSPSIRNMGPLGYRELHEKLELHRRVADNPSGLSN